MLDTSVKTQNKMSQGAGDQIYTILNKIQRNVVISCSCSRAKAKTYFKKYSFSDAVSKNIELGKFPDEKERCDVGDRGIL